MTEKRDKLRKLLKRNWRVKIDEGHKSALRYKMTELQDIENSDEQFEYADGHWTTKDERVATRTVIRTDWRPVWVATFILLAVVIILLPHETISGNKSPLDVQSASPQELIIRGFAPSGSRILDKSEAQYISIDKSRIEKRFVYMIGDLTFESKQELSGDKIRDIFMDLGGKEIDLSKISTLEVMLPEDYYLETREGSIIYYGVTRVD